MVEKEEDDLYDGLPVMRIFRATTAAASRRSVTNEVSNRLEAEKDCHTQSG